MTWKGRDLLLPQPDLTTEHRDGELIMHQSRLVVMEGGHLLRFASDLGAPIARRAVRLFLGEMRWDYEQAPSQVGATGAHWLPSL